MVSVDVKFNCSTKLSIQEISQSVQERKDAFTPIILLRLKIVFKRFPQQQHSFQFGKTALLKLNVQSCQFPIIIDLISVQNIYKFPW